MSNQLARPSNRRLRRLTFRPLADVTDIPEEDATLKVPVSTSEQGKSNAELLVTLPFPQEETQKHLAVQQVDEENLPVTPPGGLARLDKNALPLPTKLAQRNTVSGLLTVKLGLLKPRQFIARPSLAKDSGEIERNDDPGLSTIPMMVLTGIASEPDEKQSTMQSEISGAAGAAGLVGAGSIISVVLKYCATFLIQYGFGVGLYGLYTLSSSLINLAASVLNLGLDDAMVRYTAIYRSKQRTGSLRGLMIFCTAAAGIAGMIGALCLLFFTPSLAAFWIALKHHQSSPRSAVAQVTPLLQIMVPMIPLMCMQMVWFGGLRGFKAFKWRTLTMSILQPLLQILLLLVVLRFFRSITFVALVMLISTIFSTALNLYFLFRQITPVAIPEPEQYESREWLTFASFNFLTTIIDTVLDSIDTILLAAFGVPNAQLGEYGAAIRMSTFIAMPLLSLNNIFAPTIAELHGKGERQKLESMFKIIVRWSITFSLPIFLIMVLFSPYLLGLTGAGFVAAWPLVVAFSVGAMINAVTGPVGYMLLMTGYQRLSFLNSIAAVIVNVALGIILTPRYGAMGIAVSTGLAIVVINLLRLLQVRIFLKMHPYRWDVFKPVGAGVISATLAAALLYLLNHSSFKLHILLGHAILSAQLLLIPIFLTGYVGLLVLFKGGPEDEIVLKSLRNKFKFLRGNKQSRKKE